MTSFKVLGTRCTANEGFYPKSDKGKVQIKANK